jgi:hypothetical protein
LGQRSKSFHKDPSCSTGKGALYKFTLELGFHIQDILFSNWSKIIDSFNDAQIRLTERTLKSVKEALGVDNQTEEWKDDMASKLVEVTEQLEQLHKTDK